MEPGSTHPNRHENKEYPFTKKLKEEVPPQKDMETGNTLSKRNEKKKYSQRKY